MKIISGRYGGRLLTSPKSPQTRPMTDKVRGALLDIVGDVTGWAVLDAYAGSGAVGIEALSRGAKTVIAVELAREAAKVVEKNKTNLKIGDELTILKEAVERLPARLKGQSFDLIITDPPYAQVDPATLDLLSGLLKPSGILIVSHSSRIAPPKLESMQRINTRTYGDSSLSFYRNN